MDEKAVVRKFQKELNAGTASLVVLGRMLGADEPLYGYQIAKWLEAKAGGELPMKAGALYPVLRSMESQGLLTSQVEPSTSAPPRRYYSITDDGRRVFELWLATWETTRAFVEAVLADSLPGRERSEETTDG